MSPRGLCTGKSRSAIVSDVLCFFGVPYNFSPHKKVQVYIIKEALKRLDFLLVERRKQLMSGSFLQTTVQIYGATRKCCGVQGYLNLAP